MEKQSAKQEFLAIFKNKKLLIALGGISIIPLLYVGLFLWAFWNPYANIADLPVAIVNEDVGSEMNGKELTLGKDLTETLLKEQQFAFTELSKEEAYKALDNREYYIIIEIPSDFSKNATTLMDENPQKLILNYVPNEGFNFLSSQIGETLVEKIKSSVSVKVSETYAKTMFESIQQLADGIGTASEGSTELKEGSQTLMDGSNTLKDSLATFASKFVTFNEGIQRVANGIAQVNEKMPTLANGTSKLSEESAKLSGGMQEWQAGANALSEGITGLATGLSPLLQSMDAANPQRIQLEQTLAALQASSKKLADSATTLANGSTAVSSNLAVIAQGQQDLVNGLAELANGMEQIQSGSTQLNSASSQLSNGANDLNDGIEQLTAGVTEFNTKLKEATEESKINDLTDANYNMVAEPVELETNKINVVPNYGTGFTPYFVSLGLFVGALVISIIFPLKEPVGIPTSGISWFWSKFSVIMTIGIIQALLVDFIMLVGLKIEVQSIGYFILFSIITSLVYMTIIQFLVTGFADIGRFIAIILLILQLTTSAGTFPIELVPNFFQSLNAYLPMTYTVFGFKSIISTGDFEFMWQNVAILSIYVIVAILGTIGFLNLFRKKMYQK